MFTYDPISPVAMEISNETCLLCFDEFQVSVQKAAYASAFVLESRLNTDCKISIKTLVFVPYKCKLLTTND